jgi:hypothetical protein
MSHSAEVLRLQSALDATQTYLVWCKAEEASWSVLRTVLTRQAEYTCTHHLKVACVCMMAESSALGERHMAIKVLCK